jgi:hypothetical protein
MQRLEYIDSLNNIGAIKLSRVDKYNLDLCLKNNIELGKGYGNWKDNTIRIANFPSHTLEDFHQLFNLINS